MLLVLETTRLQIRPFVADDLPQIHRILDQTFGDGTQIGDPSALAQRRSWLQWSILSAEWLPALHQPPYGDRAVVLRETQALLGAVGYVPCLAPFEQLPELAPGAEPGGLCTPEVGLFWAIDPAQQRRGYASEAAGALIAHAFGQLRLKRIVATTEHHNTASQAVMRRLGMRLLVNPQPDPPWLQVVGLLQNTHGA